MMRDLRSKFCSQQPARSEGFALPSVLFMVVILSILSLSIVSIQYFRHKTILHDIGKVKSFHAVRNGVLTYIAEKKIAETQQYTFEDGSNCSILLMPWGCYYLISATGRYKISRANSIAVAAGIPPEMFANALTFTNKEHQLIFAGDIGIQGDVETGLQGYAIGTLPSSRTPKNIPVSGRIRRNPVLQTSLYDFSRVVSQIQKFKSLLNTSRGENLSEIDLTAAVRDTISEIVVRGNVTLKGNVYGVNVPLTIAVNGTVSFNPGTRIFGAVAIASTNPILIPSTITLENTILYSDESLEIASGSRSISQCIASNITLQKNAALEYPSAVISYPVDSTVRIRSIVIEENSSVEGSILMGKSFNPLNREDRIFIKPSAKVIGSIYCEAIMTFEGSLIGSMIVNDFYFYESPTTYFGWLRTGSINRPLLPKGYLVPIGFSQEIEFNIIDWL